MSHPDRAEEVVRFRPTSGRVMGVVALVLAIAVVVLAVFDSDALPAPVGAAAALFAVLAWAAMLRPALLIEGDRLVLRQMVETVALPLAAIEELAVRQVLAVRVGEQRYVSSVVGRSWRSTVRTGRPQDGSNATEEGSASADVDYVEYVEQEIRRRMEDARERAGVTLMSAEQEALAEGVRRETAWLPVCLMAAAVVALVVTILL